MKQRIASVIYDEMNRCIQHYMAYKAIYKQLRIEEKNGIKYVDKNNFWITCSDANLEMFFVIACKLFDSKKKNQIYFEKYIDIQTFYNELERRFGITEEEFTQMTTDMRQFRNNYIAHRDKTKIVPYTEGIVKGIFVIDTILGKTNELYFGGLEAKYDIEYQIYIELMNKSWGGY